MNRVLWRVIFLYLVFLGPAAAAFGYGLYQRQMASAGEAFSVFDFETATRDCEKLAAWLEYGTAVPRVFDQPFTATARRAAEVRYWQGAYENVIADGRNQTDPQLLFVVANAHYRSVAGERDRRKILESLDAAIESYRRAIEASPNHVDAAFNYEFLIRVRARLATLPRETPARSLHGLEGAVPKLRIDDMKMLVPMLPDEKGGMEAGKGAPKVRKG